MGCHEVCERDVYLQDDGGRANGKHGDDVGKVTGEGVLRFSTAEAGLTSSTGLTNHPGDTAVDFSSVFRTRSSSLLRSGAHLPIFSTVD